MPRKRKAVGVQPELIAGTDCIVVVEPSAMEQLAARMDAYLADRRQHVSAWQPIVGDITLDGLVCPTCDAFLPDHEAVCDRA